jgi:uncharacterized protein (TIGR02099 family)
MPSEGTHTLPVAASSRPRRLLRGAWLLLRAGIVAFALLLLVVRLVIFPRLEDNRGDLSRLLSTQIGEPVEIGAIETGWDGWNPRVDISDFRLLNRDNGSAVAVLPHMRMVVAWTSLPALSLRLKELSIDRPQLAIRRDDVGMLHVAGVTIDPETSHDDNQLADWLLRQPRIVVHDAQLAWRDERAGGAVLRLNSVELRLENRFGRHRFGLTGSPPDELAAPLDLRGDFTGNPLADWHALSGRVYARLDYADIAAWREWLPMGIPIRSGKGALRVWVDLSKGELRNVVADVVLADVDTRLAPDLPQLTLSGLEGRIGWSDDGKQIQIYTQHLGFVERDGVRFDPTDVKLTIGTGGDGVDFGRIEFARLELSPIRQIAGFLPLPVKWRDLMANLAPSGVLEAGDLQWRGEPDTLQAFSGSGRFIDLGFAGHDAIPGVTGLTGNIDASRLGGTIKLDNHAMALDMRHALGERVAFDSVQGLLRWRREGDGMRVDIDQLAFSGKELAGSAKGSYTTTAADDRGRADIVVQLARADPKQLYRYLPLSLDEHVRNWLQRAIVTGAASDVRIRLNGVLADFPFADTKSGQFQVQGRAQAVTLDYAAGWPGITDLDADIRVDGAHLSADVHSGRIYGAELTRSKVDIADMRAANPVLSIEAGATGPVNDFIRYVAQSPLDEKLQHPTEGVTIDGAGKLALKLELPLGKPEATRIAGSFTLDNNRLSIADGTPPLEHLTGTLQFTAHEISASALTADLLGGPARLSVATIDGRARIEGQGSFNLAMLRVQYPKQALLTRVSGTTDWKFGLNALPAGMTWTFESTLKGAGIELPPPVGKIPSDTVALKIERRVIDAGHDAVTASYGRIGRFVAERSLKAGDATVDRALLALGAYAGEPEQKGFWIRGNVDAVDADAWLLVTEQLDAAAAGEAMPLTGADVNIGTLTAVGRVFRELRIGATKSGGEWQIDLRGRDMAGNASWQAAAAGRPNGRMLAHLQRLAAPPAAPTVVTASATTGKSDALPVANPWPALDVSVDVLSVKNHELGKLELVAQPRGADWRIEKLAISSDEGTLAANGWWRNTRSTQQTDIDFDLDVHDAGKYLARFGLPDAVYGAPTRLRGSLAWAGSPQDFDYPTLNGSFDVDTGRGQFLKLDPGLGKLLGVLSLQAFKRRLEGDYRDMFGEGFAFDEITGNVRIQDGVMKTDDLKIVGPAAKVTITGSTDLARETQDIKVRVQPTLSGSVSVGAAALLLANPIIGAAIGAGSLLAQKIMQDPIEQMFSQQYAVSGSWSDPQVSRPGAAAANAGPAENVR